MATTAPAPAPVAAPAPAPAPKQLKFLVVFEKSNMDVEESNYCLESFLSSYKEDAEQIIFAFPKSKQPYLQHYTLPCNIQIGSLFQYDDKLHEHKNTPDATTTWNEFLTRGLKPIEYVHRINNITDSSNKNICVYFYDDEGGKKFDVQLLSEIVDVFDGKNVSVHHIIENKQYIVLYFSDNNTTDPLENIANMRIVDFSRRNEPIQVLLPENAKESSTISINQNLVDRIKAAIEKVKSNGFFASFNDDDVLDDYLGNFTATDLP